MPTGKAILSCTDSALKDQRQEGELGSVLVCVCISVCLKQSRGKRNEQRGDSQIKMEAVLRRGTEREKGERRRRGETFNRMEKWSERREVETPYGITSGEEG